MRPIRTALFFLAVASLAATARPATAQRVDLSLNVFPTTLADPNGGGAWNIVAKTSGGSVNLGIAGITVYLRDVDLVGIMVEPDVNSNLLPGTVLIGVFNGSANLLYAQNNATGPLVAGVGQAAFSDGPDPLGNPVWDGATKIFKGTYSNVVPSFSALPGQQSGANILVSTTPGTAAVGASVTSVVRVAVPEPASGMASLIAAAGALFMARRR